MVQAVLSPKLEGRRYGPYPAEHETILRRVLVGEADRRIQGFLAKLGIDRSYVVTNTFIYSVYGQRAEERHKNNPDIAAYRNRWLDALLLNPRVQAVVAFGQMADSAWPMAMFGCAHGCWTSCGQCCATASTSISTRMPGRPKPSTISSVPAGKTPLRD